MSGGGDLFAALPDDLLNQVLSFLPSREAVQLSLLSRRWRHLWRSTPAVSVRGLKGDDFCLFLSALLLHRDAGASLPPLRSFEIDANNLLTPPYDKCLDDEYYYFTCDDKDLPKVDPLVDLWIDYALSACRALSLTVRTKNKFTLWQPRSPLASPHLTMLHLEHVYLVDDLLDFSCCPALLLLTLVRCHLEGDALVSPSLERLSIVYGNIEIGDWVTPSLRCLQLSVRCGRQGAAPPPFLKSESMPWLTDPSILRSGRTTMYSWQR